MATPNVASGGSKGKQSMLPVSRSHVVASPKINKVSSGKNTKMGTTMHKAGCTGTACNC